MTRKTHMLRKLYIFLSWNCLAYRALRLS